MTAVNVEVRLRDGESQEKLVKRFFKKCKKEDIIKEYLSKTSFFKTRTQKKRERYLKNKHIRKFQKTT
jgi:ribosomal protein S21